MSNQKFNKGDLIHVVADLGPSMSHFTSDIDAIVIGSYSDLYGGDDTNSYALHLKGRGHTSWYDENQIILIERQRSDLLEVWKQERNTEIKHADLS